MPKLLCTRGSALLHGLLNLLSGELFVDALAMGVGDDGFRARPTQDLRSARRAGEA